MKMRELSVEEIEIVSGGAEEPTAIRGAAGETTGYFYGGSVDVHFIRLAGPVIGPGTMPADLAS